MPLGLVLGAPIGGFDGISLGPELGSRLDCMLGVVEGAALVRLGEELTTWNRISTVAPATPFMVGTALNTLVWSDPLSMSKERWFILLGLWLFWLD